MSASSLTSPATHPPGLAPCACVVVSPQLRSYLLGLGFPFSIVKALNGLGGMFGTVPQKVAGCLESALYRLVDAGRHARTAVG